MPAFARAAKFSPPKVRLPNYPKLDAGVARAAKVRQPNFDVMHRSISLT